MLSCVTKISYLRSTAFRAKKRVCDIVLQIFVE